MTSLKWWMSASIEVPMIFFTWSRLWPMPSAPSASCAGQAILVSSTMTGPGVSLSRACSTIRSDWRISSTRMRNRPYASAVSVVATSKSYCS